MNAGVGSCLNICSTIMTDFCFLISQLNASCGGDDLVCIEIGGLQIEGLRRYEKWNCTCTSCDIRIVSAGCRQIERSTGEAASMEKTIHHVCLPLRSFGYSRESAGCECSALAEIYNRYWGQHPYRLQA
jgi:hypothetical protein